MCGVRHRAGGPRARRRLDRHAVVTARLSYSQAAAISEAVLKHRRERNLQPLVVVVLDVGGQVLVANYEDGVGVLLGDIAYAKAWGALGLGRGGRRIAAHADRDPLFIAALSSISGGRITGSRGGSLIEDVAGNTLGVVGAAGDHGAENDECVVHGIEHAGLVANAG